MLVRQNADRSRFELDVEGKTAFLNYRLHGGEMLLTHTETPAALRGRGIGERVVLGTLEQARAQKLRVRPLCSFVRHVMAQHPQFDDLLA